MAAATSRRSRSRQSSASARWTPKPRVNPVAEKKRYLLDLLGATVAVTVNLGDNDAIDELTVQGHVAHVELGGFSGAKVHLLMPGGTGTVDFPIAAILDLAVIDEDGVIVDSADDEDEGEAPADEVADGDSPF